MARCPLRGRSSQWLAPDTVRWSVWFLQSNGGTRQPLYTEVQRIQQPVVSRISSGVTSIPPLLILLRLCGVYPNRGIAVFVQASPLRALLRAQWRLPGNRVEVIRLAAALAPQKWLVGRLPAARGRRETNKN